MFSKIRLQTGFTLVFSAVMLLIIFSIYWVIDFFVLDAYEQVMVGNSRQLNIEVAEQVDLYLNDLNQLSKNSVSNQNLMDDIRRLDKLGNELTQYETLFFDRNFESYSSYLLNYSEMSKSNVYIFGRKNRFKFAYGTLPLESNFETIIAEKTFGDDVLGKAIFHFQNPNTAAETEKSSISVIRAFSEINGHVLGYIEIQQDYSMLNKIADLGEAGSVYILDSAGQIVYPAEALQSDTIRLLHDIIQSGQQGTRVGNSLYTFHISEESGFTTVIRHSNEQVFKPFYRLRNTTLIAIVLVCIVSILFIYFVAGQMTKPIRMLRTRVLKFDWDNVDVFTKQKSHHNEINLLNDAFQQMIDRLRQSLEREVAASREEMKARFSALQAQIEPHFIHNMLYLISICAEEGRNRDVINMCKRLSDMLRYMAESGERIVTLADEMAYTMNYLTLIQYKYEDFLELEIDVQKAAENVPLPRMTIQPFVENAIKHAFNDSDPPWKIGIVCRAGDAGWEVIIEDNGGGMEPDKRNSLRSQIAELLAADTFTIDQREGTGGLGIINTVMRLKMLYADSLRFELGKGSKGGTRIHIQAALHVRHLSEKGG